MKRNYLLITLFFSLLILSCKETNKEISETEAVVPVETEAVIENNINKPDTDTIAKKTQEEEGFRAGGNNPYWTVHFTKGKILFKAPGAPLQSYVAPIPEPEIVGNTKKYVANSHKVDMEILLTEEECISAISDKKNTHKVKVTLKTVKDDKPTIYEGCGS